jgi:hypothetical protein
VTRAALLACVLMLGCKAPELGFAIALTIDATQLDDARRGLVTQLDVVGHSDADHHARIELGRALGEEERVIIRPPEGTTSISLTVQALDGAGKVVAAGDSMSLTMTPGHTTETTIPLLVPGSVDLGGADLSGPPRATATAHLYGRVIAGGVNLAAIGDFDNPPDGRTDVLLASSNVASVALYPSTPTAATYEVLNQYALGNGLRPTALAIAPVLPEGGTEIVVLGARAADFTNCQVDLYAYSRNAFSAVAVDKGLPFALSPSPDGLAVGRSEDPTASSPSGFDDRVAVYSASKIHVGGLSVTAGFVESGATGYLGAERLAFGQLDPSIESWSEMVYARDGVLHVAPNFTQYPYDPDADTRYSISGKALGLLVADLDGQKGNDVLVLTSSNVQVLRNQGSGEVLDPAVTMAVSADPASGLIGFDVGDLNHDGKLDIVVVDRDKLQVIVLYNRGTLPFVDIDTFSLTLGPPMPQNAKPLAIGFADLDGVGGRDDLVVPLEDGEVFALVNTTP